MTNHSRQLRTAIESVKAGGDQHARRQALDVHSLDLRQAPLPDSEDVSRRVKATLIFLDKQDD